MVMMTAGDQGFREQSPPRQQDPFIKLDLTCNYYIKWAPLNHRDPFPGGSTPQQRAHFEETSNLGAQLTKHELPKRWHVLFVFNGLFHKCCRLYIQLIIQQIRISNNLFLELEPKVDALERYFCLKS